MTGNLAHRARGWILASGEMPSLLARGVRQRAVS
jgi:hypothetical protein